MTTRFLISFVVEDDYYGAEAPLIDHVIDNFDGMFEGGVSLAEDSARVESVPRLLPQAARLLVEAARDHLADGAWRVEVDDDATIRKVHGGYVVEARVFIHDYELPTPETRSKP
jgi:hypothetical protein